MRLRRISSALKIRLKGVEVPVKCVFDGLGALRCV